MRVGSLKSGRITVAMAVLALLAGACSGGSTASPGTSAEASPPASVAPGESPAGGPVAVCELAYYTGEFAPYGPSLTADVTFPVEEVINLDPPLGRPWEMYSEDLGTVGEAQAAKTCLEKHNAEIVVSIAHGYRTYRDFMMQWWQEHDSPLGPTVHGGLIPGNLGGKAAEPLFRAQGLDEALGIYGVLYAQSIDAKNIVIFATQVEGFQTAATAAEKAAPILGVNVLARIDAPAEQSSYAAEASKIASLKPDAVIAEAGSVESATIIKQAAEAGLSIYWIGEPGWSQPEFTEALGTAPIPTQQGIGYAGFTQDTTTPAWEFFEPLWNNTEGYGNLYGDATNPYAWTSYDLMVQTALAVEIGGSYKASDWAPAMFKVGDPAGEACYTYADCLKLVRAGKAIKYHGVTGPSLYTEGGVNAVTPAFIQFGDDGKAMDPVLLDPAKGLEVLDQIKTTAECDPENPPNECEW